MLRYAINNVCVYGDERDEILSKFYAICAQYGRGRVYYSKFLSPIDVSHMNKFSSFRSVIHNKIPSLENQAGLVRLVINKPIEEIE